MISTDLDLTVLDNLDFELPCEVKSRHGGDCPDTAEWALIYRNHCSAGNGDSTICTGHRDYLMANGDVVCGTCKTSVPFLPYLVRIERLRP